jgi:hypothetical protein
MPDTAKKKSPLISQPFEFDFYEPRRRSSREIQIILPFRFDPLPDTKENWI